MQYVDIDLVSRIPSVRLEAPYLNIPSNANSETLQSLVTELLKNGDGLPSSESELLFDFFIESEILTTSIAECILKHNINTESKIPIEFDLKKSIPKNFHLKNQGMVSCVTNSNSGIVIASYNNPIKFLNETGNELFSLNSHVKNVKCLETFTALNSNYIASSGFDTHIKIHEYFSDEFKVIGNLKGHSSTVLSLNFLEFNSDEFLISTCFGGQIGIWDVSNDEIQNMKNSQNFRTPLMIIGTHGYSSTGTAGMGGSKFISCGMDSTIKVWDIDSASCNLSLPLDIQMTCISYNQNKKLCLVGSTQPITELISVNSENPRVIQKIEGVHQNGIFYVEFCEINDDYFCTGSWDGFAYLWDVRKSEKPCAVIHKGKERIMTGCWKDSVVYLGTAGGSVLSYNLKQYL